MAEQMTPEKYTKLKAHEYIMCFKNLGISWEKSKLAAIALHLRLKEQYLKHATLTPEQRSKALVNFDRLESDINAY
jgi:hypothetical protein